jgi:hypothetical protein
MLANSRKGVLKARFISRSPSSFTTGGRSVSQFVSVSGTPLEPMTRFFFFLFFFVGKLLCSSSWGALSDERTGLQFAVQSVSGQSRGGLVTIHYCLIRDHWLPLPSPLTTRSDYGGSFLSCPSAQGNPSRGRRVFTISLCRCLQIYKFVTTDISITITI